MAKRSARRATPQPIRTLKELAALVERDVGTVSRWLKRDDWPFGRLPLTPASVPKILRWAADSLAPRAEAEPADGADESKSLRKQKLREEIRKLRANADQAETALARERGALMDAAAVEEEWAKIALYIRNGFQNLASQLVPLAMTHGMPSEAAAAFGQQIEAAVNGILRHLSRDGTEDAADGA